MNTPRKPGPQPGHVHIEGDWQEAVNTALKKPPPPKPGSTTGKKKPRQN
jgi:hypothetical protein